jgi:hypothetical protein
MNPTFWRRVRLRNSLVVSKPSLVASSFVYTDEIPKILKLKTISLESPRPFYSTNVSTHMRVRDTQTAQMKKKKTEKHDEKLDRNRSDR